ncbi:MAG: rRNA maturation RNase YbeY [Candidatus Eremiobacteraeota bacterium]|nr:rRNA maturation RNase YbeY [Candidatus Eremiobacteraeota bacterium]MBV8355269.1 rRNA maturation RNase YbeY [Candidatus Eremiobacteraeota bacterium]
MPVTLTSRARKRRVSERALRALRVTAQRLLEVAGRPNDDLSVTLVGDRAIRTLNRRFRGKDRRTDVLSFPIVTPRERFDDRGPSRLLGDVVISLDTARRQARAYDAPLVREIERLLIHGILHLLGHDHERPAQRRRMEKEERRLADAIGMEWPY